MALNRRGFLRAAPAGAVSVPEIARQVGQKLRSTTPAPTGYAGVDEVPGSLGTADPITMLARKAAHKQLRAFERGKQTRNFYRGVYTAYYPDIEELRSVSPAAKRYIAAERHIRERREEHSLTKQLRKLLNWIEPDDPLANDPLAEDKD